MTTIIIIIIINIIVIVIITGSPVNFSLLLYPSLFLLGFLILICEKQTASFPIFFIFTSNKSEKSPFNVFPHMLDFKRNEKQRKKSMELQRHANTPTVHRNENIKINFRIMPQEN